MKIAICDDNKNVIEQIEEYFEILQDRTLEFEVFFCAEELQKYIIERKIDFDVFILDIQMKDVSGIELAREVRRENINALIIFMTNYSQYVFDVFEMITFDFIQKPLTFEKFKTILDKAQKYLGITKTAFAFSYKKSSYSIPFQRIDYLEKQGRKVWIYVTDGKKYQCNMTLGDVWKQLDADIFILLNKSLIINISKVERIEGEYVILKNEVKLYVSRTYRKELKKKHFNYVGGMI